LKRHGRSVLKIEGSLFFVKKNGVHLEELQELQNSQDDISPASIFQKIAIMAIFNYI